MHSFSFSFTPLNTLKILFILKKKLVLMALTCFSVFAYAEKIVTWTSTCGVKHSTTYPDSWTETQIKNDIKNINETQCGVRPNVINMKVTKVLTLN